MDNPIPRARYEGQIKRLDTWSGRELEDAITRLAFRNGLSWFTDEQIAEIRDEIIAKEWDRRCRQNATRAHNRAVLEEAIALAKKHELPVPPAFARQSTETTHV